MSEPELPEPLEAEPEDPIRLAERANHSKFKEGLSLLGRALPQNSYAYLRLDCAGKEVIGLSHSLSRFPYLQYIDLTDNAIENLQGIAQQRSLIKANLSKNKLSHIADFSKNNASFAFLQVLDLSHNLIEHAVFAFCPGLVHLNLSSNVLKTLEVTSLCELTRLEIRKNELEAIINIRDCQKLREIYAGENKFASLAVFAELPRLEVLHLRANPVTDTQGYFPVLFSLNLRQTHVQAFPDWSLQFPALMIINLLSTPLAEQDQFIELFIRECILNTNGGISFLKRKHVYTCK